MKKMISILTVLVLSIVTMLPVKVMAAEYPHKQRSKACKFAI